MINNLSATKCGGRAFSYIRDFLSDREALLRIEDDEYGPYLMGTRGRDRGAAPLLFNIALMYLPRELARIPGVQHALYTDDISIWSTQGNLREMEACLQQAASVAESYASACGLQCAPAKSEVVHIETNVKHKTRICLDHSGVPIREVEEIRILGLYIHSRLKIDTTIAKLKKAGELDGRMIHRVSNKRG